MSDQLAALVALLPDAVAVFDAEGVEIAHNPAFAALALPATLAEVGTALARPEGASTWLAPSLHECRITGPNILGQTLLTVIAVTQDPQLLRTIIDALPVTAHLKDQELRYRLVNRFATDRWGQTEHDMVGRTAREVFPNSAELARVEIVDAQVLATGIAQSYRSVVSQRPMWGVKSRLTLPGGTHAVLSIGIDVRDAIAAERVARRQSALLDAMIEGSPEGMLTLDAEGRIHAFNAAAEVIFATTRARWLGQPVAALLADPLPAPGADWQLITLTRADGSTVPADIAVTETRFESDVFRSIRLRDASERLHREQALIKAREVALSASKLKSQFLAMLGHELLTPLHGIIGFGELIRDANPGKVEAVWAGEALSSAHGLLEIVTAMIDLMRIEGGLLAMRPQLIDLKRLLRERARAWSHRDASRVTVTVELPTDLPAVLADGPRLRQALDNLLSNATRFSPPESTVDVVAEREGACVVLRIHDCGPGMTADALASALEPFRQADGRLARSVNGLGLGLPIARGLIELLGGELTIDTAPMAGTTVVLRLPAGSNP